jgi:hypothetical protein
MMRRMPTNQTTSLQVVLFSLLCLVTKLSSGFNVAPSTTTALTSITRCQQQQQHALSKKSHITNNFSLRLQAHPSSCHNINYSHQRRGSSSNNIGGALFPQREQNHHHHSSKQITSLQMSDDTNNSNNNGVSENHNLLVRIWSKLRIFMAKLWVSHTNNEE